MPTYEFRCPRGHEFEKFYRSISRSEAQAACPDCGELAERILSPTGFSFKGSGFYITDYGRDAHRDTGATHHRTEATESGGDGHNGAKPEVSSAATTGGAKGSEGGSAASTSASAATAAESKSVPKKSSGE